MARKYKVGDEIQGQSNHYEIVKILNKGALAIAYAAKQSQGSGRVFLKQYKSPSPKVEWYKEWIAYQDQLNTRLKRGKARDYAIVLIEAFECAHPRSSQPDNPRFQAYHQVFPFSSDGEDLKKKLEQDPDWSTRIKYAVEFIEALQIVHHHKVVHTDLKPENVYVKDVGSADTNSGQVKLIDFDFSILTDVTPPWEGHTGYVGTPGYMSPEHLQKKRPISESDVFTAGLILYELLTDGHPYIDVEPTDILNHTARRPKFLERIEHVAYDELRSVLYNMLNPNPKKRPSLVKVLKALKAYQLETVLETRKLDDLLNSTLVQDLSLESLADESNVSTARGDAPSTPKPKPSKPKPFKPKSPSRISRGKKEPVKSSVKTPTAPKAPRSPKRREVKRPTRKERTPVVERRPRKPVSRTPEPVDSSDESSSSGILSMILVLILIFLGGYYYFGAEENLEEQIVLEPNVENTIPRVPVEQKITEPTSVEEGSDIVEEIEDVEEVEEERYINSAQRDSLITRAQSLGWDNANEDIESKLTPNDFYVLDGALKKMEELEQELRTLQFLMRELDRGNPLKYPFDKAAIDSQLSQMFKTYHERRLQRFTKVYLKAANAKNTNLKGKLYPQYQRSLEQYLLAQAMKKYPDHKFRKNHVEHQRDKYIEKYRPIHRRYAGYVSLMEVLNQREISFGPKQSADWSKQVVRWQSQLASKCENVLNIDGPSDTLKQFESCL